MKYVILSSFLFYISISVSVFAQESLRDFTEKADIFLNVYVKEGKVDYEKIKKNKQDLQPLISSIANQALASATLTERKAFYINAYNLLVIHQVTNNMPLKEDWYQSGFFDKIKHKVAGEAVTLDVLQKERLFALDRDERIHFAIVCAAKGCPPLQSKAYYADDLERQLREQATKTLNNPYFIRLDFKNNTVAVSEIFRWYEKDFINGANNVLAYINKYRAEKIPMSFKVTYYPYDWNLNN